MLRLRVYKYTIHWYKRTNNEATRADQGERSILQVAGERLGKGDRTRKFFHRRRCLKSKESFAGGLGK